MAINFAATLDNKNILAAVREAQAAMGKLSQAVEGVGDSVDEATSSIKEMIKQAAALGGISLGMAGVKEFLTQMVSVRKEMQGFQISLSTLLGDKDKASAMFSELKNFATTTPLMLNSLAGGAQTMLGFDIAAERVIPTLKEIGDISMGDSQKFNSLVLAFSQMSATGKLMGQDLLQMINAGFNPLTEISRKTGKSIATLKDEMSAGAISAEMVAEAFTSATSEGGKFYGMLAKQGAGLAGQINTLNGALDDMYNSLAESSEGAIASAISGITSLIQNYEKVGKVIEAIVLTYGAYRAALIATVAAERIRILGLKDAIHWTWMEVTATKAATVAQNLLNKAVKANPYVLAATAITAVVGAMWAFKDSSSAAEKAQKELNKEQQAFIEKTNEQKRKTEELLGVLDDTTSSDYKRVKALQALKDFYPQIFSKYDIESIKLANILDLKQQIAQADTQRAAQQLNADIDAQTEKVKKLKLQQQTWGGQGKELQKEQEKLALLLEQRGDVVAEQFTAHLNDLTAAQLEKYASILQAQRSKMKDGNTVQMKLPTNIKGDLSDIAVFSAEDIDNLLSVVNKTKEQKTKKVYTYREDAEKAYSDWLIAKKAYDKLMKSRTATAAEVKKKSDELKTLDDAYKSITNKSAQDRYKESLKAAQENLNNKNKIRDIEEKQAKDEARAVRDQVLNTEQARIDAMKDGTEKTLAQIDLDYAKQREAIKREEEDLRDEREKNARELWEAQNAELVKKNANAWKDSGQQAKWRKNYTLSEEDQNYFNSKIGAADADLENRTKQETEAALKAMQEYLISYGNYEEQKKAISDKYTALINQAQADANEGLVKTLEAQLSRELDTIDSKFGQAKQGIEGIFSDLENISTQSVQKAIDAYERLLDYMKDGNLSENEMKNLTEFGFSTTFLKQVNTAEVDVNALKEALKKLKQQADNSQTALKKLANAWKDAFDGSKSPEERMNSLFDAMNSVNNAVSMVTSTVGTMASAFGNSGLANVMDDIGNVMSSTMSMAQQGAAIAGPWGAAAGAAMGLAASMAEVFSKRHDESLQKQIESVDKKIKSLDKSFENLQNIVDDTFGTRKSEALDQQIENLQQQNRLIREQISLESQKKNTDESTIESYKDAIDENTKRIKELREEAVNAIFGEDLKSAIEDFASAYADAWASNTNRTRAAKDQVRDMMKQMVTESIKSAIEASGAMQKIREKMAEFYKDGIISDAEQQAIYKEAETLQRELDKQFGWADNLFDNTQDFSSATSGGFQAMSQESADELNGRFANGQITMEGILQQTMMIYAANQQMVTVSTESNEVLKEMRNLMITMGSHVEDIATYTKLLTTFGEKFDQMNRYLQKL